MDPSVRDESARRQAYELIEAYAMIADTHSAGLVSRTGSIDWLCLPRFDSPSTFAALLDAEQGGRWTLRPVAPVTATERSYRDGSMVLETTMATDHGRFRIVDFLAIESTESDAPRAYPEEVVARVVEGLEGAVEIETHITPRFGYGDVSPWLQQIAHGWQAVGGPDAVDFRATVPLERDGTGLRARFTVRAGEQQRFTASFHRPHEHATTAAPEHVPELLARTDDVWRAWSRRCSYQGPWRDLVVRSLLVIKSLTYSPSGGIVAAPTTSLPEHLGGTRNWDYRYCWLRDATFALDALLDFGYTDEASQWVGWLLRALAGDPQDMQIMYGVVGERRLWEHELDWLEGYEGSGPVRIGNGAHDQFQLDVYGELMDAFHSARRAGLTLPPEAWELQKVIVGFVRDRWREPDNGIWEVRSQPEHFVHSKVMAWVAIDRAVKAVERFGKDGDVDAWRAIRREIRDDVMAHGVDDHGCFTRSYDDGERDASLLMLPLVGFVHANSEVMRRTIDSICEDLMVDGLLLRYRTDRARDGLPPGEAPFLMVSFWLVDCLALQGRVEEAAALFERLTSIANDVGLLSEEYDPRARRFLGNFPQAFSHVALLTAAKSLETAGRARGVLRGE